MEVFRGEIIRESLADTEILKRFKIIATRVSLVTAEHNTPWLKEWTLHSIEIPAARADEIAVELSEALDSKHAGSWYVDFKSSNRHYVIYPGKVFRIERSDAEQYREASEYGISIGIPAHQVNFAPNILKAI